MPDRPPADVTSVSGIVGRMPEWGDLQVDQLRFMAGRHGEEVAYRDLDAGTTITFAEWGYLGKGKFQRRDFRLDVLTGSSAFSADGSLFSHLGKHEIFTPTKTYPPMTVSELAAATTGDAAKEAV